MYLAHTRSEEISRGQFLTRSIYNTFNNGLTLKFVYLLLQELEMLPWLGLTERTTMHMEGKKCLKDRALWSHKIKISNDNWNISGKINGIDSATDFYRMDHENSWSSLRNLSGWINTVNGARFGHQFYSTHVRLKPSLRYNRVNSILLT